MNSYRFSSDANTDIEAIVLYISGLNPVAANHFLNALEKTCELLAEHSHIGRLRPELGENLRSFPVGNYLIFYVPASHGIDVARVLYGVVIYRESSAVRNGIEFNLPTEKVKAQSSSPREHGAA